MSDGRLNIYNNYLTSYKNDYYQKYSDIYQLHVPKITEQPGLNKYHGKHFRYGTKPIRQYNQQICKPINIEPNYNIPQKNHSPIKTNVSINPTETGYIKYLDIMATTNALDYVSYNYKDTAAISANKNITYANWLGITKPLQKPFKYKQVLTFDDVKNKYNQGSFPEFVPKKLNEFRNLKKTIPHNGFLSEQKDKFQKPIPTVLLNFQGVLNVANYGIGKSLPEWTTENQMYGSRNRLQKFLNINKK